MILVMQQAKYNEFRDSMGSKITVSYKIIIAVLFGLIGFAVNFIDITLPARPYPLTLALGLIFPLCISMAWGWKYGLLSALAGGTQSFWFLYQGHGWGAAYSVPLFVLWIVWHGLWSKKRQHRGYWYTSPFIIEIPFRTAAEIGYYTVFIHLVSYNPPFWNSAAAFNSVNLAWLHAAGLQDVLTAYVSLFIVYIFLTTGYIRVFFRLPKRRAQRDTNVLYAAAFLLGCVLWLVSAVIEYYLLTTEYSFWDVLLYNDNPLILYMRLLFFGVTFSGAVIIAKINRGRISLHKSLEESRKRYKDLFESSNDGYLFIDVDAHITDCNTAFCAMTGCPYGDMTGKTYYDITPVKRHAADSEILYSIMYGESESEVFKTELFTSSGSLVPVEVKMYPVHGLDGRISGFWSVVRDMTFQKKSRELLESQKNRLQFIIEGTHIGTWEWNVQSGELIVNERWAGIIGYTRDDINPVSIQTWKSCAHPDDLKESDILLQKHFQGEVEYYHFESRMKHKSGKWIWVLDRRKVVSWTNGAKPE